VFEAFERREKSHIEGVKNSSVIQVLVLEDRLRINVPTPVLPVAFPLLGSEYLTNNAAYLVASMARCDVKSVTGCCH